MLLPLLLAASASLPGAGLWEYRADLLGMGKTEQKCLTEAEVRRFLTDPGNRRYDCDWSTRDVAAGRVRLKGVCVNRKHPEQKASVSLAGDYALERFDLKGQASAKVIGDLELPVSAAVTAHRVSAECPAPAPGTAGPPTPTPTPG